MCWREPKIEETSLLKYYLRQRSETDINSDSKG